jgi:hypothetical protein
MIASTARVDDDARARGRLRVGDNFKAANLLGTRVAETILASVHVRTQQKAGHMNASDLIKILPKTSCEPAADEQILAIAEA